MQYTVTSVVTLPTGSVLSAKKSFEADDDTAAEAMGKRLAEDTFASVKAEAKAVSPIFAKMADKMTMKFSVHRGGS